MKFEFFNFKPPKQLPEAPKPKLKTITLQSLMSNLTIEEFETKSVKALKETGLVNEEEEATWDEEDRILSNRKSDFWIMRNKDLEVSSNYNPDLFFGEADIRAKAVQLSNEVKCHPRKVFYSVPAKSKALYFDKRIIDGGIKFLRMFGSEDVEYKLDQPTSFLLVKNRNATVLIPDEKVSTSALFSVPLPKFQEFQQTFTGKTDKEICQIIWDKEKKK